MFFHIGKILIFCNGTQPRRDLATFIKPVNASYRLIKRLLRQFFRQIRLMCQQHQIFKHRLRMLAVYNLHILHLRFPLLSAQSYFLS